MTMGQRIRAARLAKGWNQQALAARAGITQQAIDRIEKGLSKPTYDSIKALVSALGVTLADLDPEVAPPKLATSLSTEPPAVLTLAR